MSAATTRSLAHIFSNPAREWSPNPLWRRMCDGFQETVQRIITEEPPATAPAAAPFFMPSSRAALGPANDAAAGLKARWTLVLSDTDNDFNVVLSCLWQAGLCDRSGGWRPGLPPFRVVHTGDWLNKWRPNPHVLDGFKRLRQTVPEGGELILLNGNHELSILQMAERGMRTSLTAEDLAFIRDQEILHAEPGMLFLHGYPSLDLLLALKQLRREEIPLEAFNARLKKSYFEGRYPLFMEPRGLEMIGDIRKPKAYYDRDGGEGLTVGSQVGGLLQALGLYTVIHGHRPLSTVQLDHELAGEVPGVRLVNNDNHICQSGLGGMVIAPDGGIRFINPETVRAAGGLKPFRKKLRKRLGTRNKDLGIRKPSGRAAAVPIAA